MDSKVENLENEVDSLSTRQQQILEKLEELSVKINETIQAHEEGEHALAPLHQQEERGSHSNEVCQGGLPQPFGPKLSN